MSNSSILGGSAAPARAPGKNVDLLGPSDTSDSGSDVQGERSMPTGPDSPDEWGAVVVGTGNDSDASGTGERASAGGDDPARDGDDILPDHLVDDAVDSDVSPESTAAEDIPEDAGDEEGDEAGGSETDSGARPRGGR